jgi:2-polyprenyl-3-methyl-5-hydroxy-6-metoxy-1,4-benzoquinol methylase
MRTKRILRALLEMRINIAHYLPYYHQSNAHLFNRRYKKGLAPWCEISSGLFHWLSKLREEAAVLAPEGRIVDIGCGNGKLTSRLSTDSREVVGLDISTEAIKLAKKHERGNLKFSVHNIEHDPLEGENSLIICEDILYYIPSVSMKKVIKKLSDALVEGGILLVIDSFPKIWRRGITISCYPNS